jgi:hypothetical protein
VGKERWTDRNASLKEERKLVDRYLVGKERWDKEKG